MYKVASAANVKSPGEKVCVGSNFGFKKREGERKGEGKCLIDMVYGNTLLIEMILSLI